MNSSRQAAQNAAPHRVPEGVREVQDAANEDDFALGWECANPALQIEVWGREAAAQPLQSHV